MAVQALTRMHHASRFELFDRPLWQDAGSNTTSAGVPTTGSTAPSADASLAILFQLEVSRPGFTLALKSCSMSIVE